MKEFQPSYSLLASEWYEIAPSVRGKITNIPRGEMHFSGRDVKALLNNLEMSAAYKAISVAIQYPEQMIHKASQTFAFTLLDLSRKTPFQ